MDQTLDQVIKTRKIKFNGRTMKQQQQGQGGQGKQKQFVKRTSGPGFVKTQSQRKQNFVQFRPRGQLNQRRPQQFQRMNRNMMIFGGIQKRNTMGGQFMMGNRQNFQQRRPFGQQQQFVMQGGFMRPQQFRRNMMQMGQQPRRMLQQRNNFQQQMRLQQQNRPMQQNQATKLYISNLDFGVTNQDVKELFSEFGPVVRYGVNFSSAGRSVGSAEVLFKNKISAIKAMQKYDGVTLDGRPMKLAIAGGAPVMHQNQQVQRQRQPMKQRLPQQKVGNKMNRMMKFVPKKVAAKQIVAKAVLRNVLKKKQMGGRVMKSKMMFKKKAAPNAEQLDADLEAYAASKD